MRACNWCIVLLSVVYCVYMYYVCVHVYTRICICIRTCLGIFPYTWKITNFFCINITFMCYHGRMKFLNMEFEDNKVKETLLEIMASIVEHISTITTALQYIYDK